MTSNTVMQWNLFWEKTEPTEETFANAAGKCEIISFINMVNVSCSHTLIDQPVDTEGGDQFHPKTDFAASTPPTTGVEPYLHFSWLSTSPATSATPR